MLPKAHQWQKFCENPPKDTGHITETVSDAHGRKYGLEACKNSSSPAVKPIRDEVGAGCCFARLFPCFRPCVGDCFRDISSILGWIFTKLSSFVHLLWTRMNWLGFGVKRSNVKVTLSRRRRPALDAAVEFSFLVWTVGEGFSRFVWPHPGQRIIYLQSWQCRLYFHGWSDTCLRYNIAVSVCRMVSSYCQSMRLLAML